MEERSKRTKIEADRVLQEIAALAFHNIEDYCDWDEEGNLDIKPGKEIPRQLKAAIRSAQSTTVILDVYAIVPHFALTSLVIAKEQCFVQAMYIVLTGGENFWNQFSGGAKVVRHSIYVIFQMAEVVISKKIFAEILLRIERLRCCPA